MPVLIFSMVIWLFASVYAETAEATNKIEKQKAQLKYSVKDNKNVLELLNQKNDQLKKQKEKIWEEAWRAKESLCLARAGPGQDERPRLWRRRG